VIGSGCAGLNAADWLYDLGERDFVLLTEGMSMGTSRNTGSDKQTYYKLSLSADETDSIGDLARALSSGGGMNKDTALVEAASSLKCFYKLANLGVPFPTNEYGEYVGYKTDHDPRKRATSAGPLTSRYMTERLESAVLRKGVEILDGFTAIRLVVRDGRIAGLIAIDAAGADQENMGITYISCSNIILATGGPAMVYSNSVYPQSQTGMTGMALEAGARGANLQEWQYGLASTDFRWNVSGTYQQALPRYIAVDKHGNEREFLNEYFDDPFKAADMAFLKGYQWPFDTKKLCGSSMIDIIVQHEIFSNDCSVYLDFRRNPGCIDEHGFSRLGAETREYLDRSGALCGTPIERLAIMNSPAIDLYARNGIDLYTQPLRIAVCAQHCNGGIEVDVNWETCIEGLFAAGEAAGTFGPYRPGGSALNSTQVGSMRAAEKIAFTSPENKPVRDFGKIKSEAETEISRLLEQIKDIPQSKDGVKVKDSKDAKDGADDTGLSGAISNAQINMSGAAAHIRSENALIGLANDVRARLSCIFEAPADGSGDLRLLFKYRDMLITQLAMASAIETGIKEFGTRGSAMALSGKGTAVSDKLADYRCEQPRETVPDKIVVTKYRDGNAESCLADVRPEPEYNNWFETVWKDYRRRTRQER